MTIIDWDADQAVTRGPLDEDLEGCCSIDRYGITDWEEGTGEPLSVALAQEEADLVPTVDSDDQWVFVDDDAQIESAFGRLDSPEEQAMHVETV